MKYISARMQLIMGKVDPYEEENGVWSQKREEDLLFSIYFLVFLIFKYPFELIGFMFK